MTEHSRGHNQKRAYKAALTGDAEHDHSLSGGGPITVEVDGSTAIHPATVGRSRHHQPIFKSLGDTWADTGTSAGRLMIAVLGGSGRVRAGSFRARTGEGRKRAKARGVKMGRKPKLTPHQQVEALKRRNAGEPIREIARTYKVHNSTISRLS